MKKLIHNLEYLFDYYLGYFLYSRAGVNDKWSDYMINKYPEKHPNEVKYLKEKNQKTNK